MYQIKNIMPDIQKPAVLHLPKFSIGCYFRAEKYRADGTITYKGPWFANTVLNTGLDNLEGRRSLEPGQTYSAARFVNVGTGTSEPAITQSGLDTFLASTSTTYGSQTTASSSGDEGAGDPAWRSYQQTLAFAIGGCTGNLSELGLSYSSNSSYLNRQLFRDDVGDPTVITVLSDEGLRITVKTIMYATMAVGETSTGTININGSSVGYTIALQSGWLTWAGLCIAYLDGYSSVISIATEGGSFVRPNSFSKSSYVNGNYYNDEEGVWNPGRFTGDWKRIKTTMQSDGGQQRDLFIITLDTAQTIVDTEEVKLTLRRSWGRV